LPLYSVPAQTTNRPASPTAKNSSELIEAAGRVEVFNGSRTNWRPATAGLALFPGDRLRTLERSRAAVQLSDHSVIRLNERTTLEILPPRNEEKRRFGLPGGSLYFFNREKPSDVEFDTPLAAGAIRGTEFVLEVAEADQALHLALIDGLVGLQTKDGEVSLRRGEDLRLARGQPARKTALVNATAVIQWALYYPAVLNPNDLSLSPAEESSLDKVLGAYRAGDLLAALEAWPAGVVSSSASVTALHAQLLLAVGRVDEAEKTLQALPSSSPLVRALRELIDTVRTSANQPVANTRTKSAGDFTASEWLAHTYSLQARFDLPGALAAAEQAVERAPQFGGALVRLAELRFAFGERAKALESLDRAEQVAPRLAPAFALRGFILLEQGHSKDALEQFDRARALDAAFGPSWLGRGLSLMRARDYAGARASLQAAAALEPQRGLFRSYLGKAAGELGDARGADKEFRLAKELDPNDPTAWLYSALQLWQENRINEAIRDLEASSDRNDNRAAFRSRLLLDADRSVRSANLAALYDDAGLFEVSRHAAARSVAEDYANFSGHLFLANSLQSQENPNRFDLRLESARQSELLVANLLAPPGAGNLSQVLSQYDHLRFFDEKPVGISSLTEYRSTGDWSETATAFGTVQGFTYALDGIYQSLNGEQPNGQSERRQVILTTKQSVGANDEAYFQVGAYHADLGDVANYYDPAQAQVGFRAREEQLPTLYAGWHHAWSPGSHTLLLFSRLQDSLSFFDPQSNALFVRNQFGTVVEVQSPPIGPPVTLDYARDLTLYSAEAQHIWETPRFTLVAGGRWQSGEVDAQAALNRAFDKFPSATDGSLERANAYGYATWRLCEPLTLIAGMSYDHLNFPRNSDLPPLAHGQDSRDQISPKVGMLFAPWKRGLFRATYNQSLGGVYFDNSVRLEPSQVAGFNQAFRSLIPESVAGLVPGTAFDTAGIGFDQSLASGTFFGAEATWLSSSGEREVGTLTNSIPFIPLPDSPGSTRQTLDFRERNVSAYAGQLLGNNVSVGAFCRLSEATLNGRFPELPAGASGVDQITQNNRALLQQVSLTANYFCRAGIFAQWESVWYHQHNSGYTPSLAGDSFWQHNVSVGYRFPQRRAELRLGLLDITGQDYRLNPLNLHNELPRHRTLATSLRLNF
jgi:predicted Zn-dependent protease